jgi:hypothetical protein
MKSKNLNAEPVINHNNWLQFEYSEEFTFSSNGKVVYIKRSFSNGQILYWTYDANIYPIDSDDGGTPSNARAYSAVNRALYTKT